MKDLYSVSQKNASNSNQKQDEEKMEKAFSYKNLKVVTKDNEIYINNAKIDKSLYSEISNVPQMSLFDNCCDEYTLTIDNNVFSINKNKIVKINGASVNIAFKDYVFPYEKELLIAKIRSEKYLYREELSSKLLDMLDMETLKKLDKLPDNFFLDEENDYLYSEKYIKKTKPFKLKNTFTFLAAAPVWAGIASLYWFGYDLKNPLNVALASLSTLVSAGLFSGSIPVIITENKKLKNYLKDLAETVTIRVNVQTNERLSGKTESKSYTVLDKLIEAIEKESLVSHASIEESKIVQKVLNSKLGTIENGEVGSISKDEFASLVKDAANSYIKLFLTQIESMYNEPITKALEPTGKEYYETGYFLKTAKDIEKIFYKLKLGGKLEEFILVLRIIAKDEYYHNPEKIQELRYEVAESLYESIREDSQSENDK